ncbi:transketolase [Martelella lutilitoris]|uniref:Transketolase n=1 Tax=Martelella lutilitoris TaxID=2583532 RepID=A0A5C4JL70_9HYPH|nr:transketolase [Martelella lutilitoris]TNB46057.1 transketolase [Martelella lutilitoris]
MLNKNPATASSIELANTIRVLSMDAVQKAVSGHPGMPMGMAEIAVALWTRHLKHNPKNPDWLDRDRFVLSNGHGSMLLYSLLHLTGYDLSMDDIRNFRQLHSKTPGHPEHDVTPGVETTTGPLGQGIANAVGMAVAEKMLAASFNKPRHKIVDHNTFVFLGDGCLMEGVSHEACSLAGTLGLGKLIALYDDNGISIDGHVSGWFTDDTPKRFEAYGWQVIRNVDGHDVEAIDAAIAEAKKNTKQPTLICCKTTIGKGSPSYAGDAHCHGNVLGDEEIARVREALGWTLPPFEVPANVYETFNAEEAGKQAESAWEEAFAAYEEAFPAEASEFQRRMSGELPADFDAEMGAFIASAEGLTDTIPMRKASQNVLQMLGDELPELVGLSADLAGSCLSIWDKIEPVTAETGGNYIYCGVREFGLGAMMNGIFLHGGFRPFGGGYVVFSDYQRNAIRMAALMKLGVVYALSHDSIAVGEDGPTHQPIEHLGSLRLMPNLDVWRPADAVEAAIAWETALKHTGTPTLMSLSRQVLPPLSRSASQADAIRRGGYVLAEAEGTPAAVIIATGAETRQALDARAALAKEGIQVRVVSMPSTFVFDSQDKAYKAEVLPAGIPRVSVEAAGTEYWRKYVGLEGGCVGIDTFGESAPPPVLFELFGITAEGVAKTVKSVIG